MKLDVCFDTSVLIFYFYNIVSLLNLNAHLTALVN